MAILTGFPPSNTISPTTRIPRIKRSWVQVGKLKREQKFRHRRAEFCVLSFRKWCGRREVNAICYKGSRIGASSPGNIYCFGPDTWVKWLEEVYD